MMPPSKDVVELNIEAAAQVLRTTDSSFRGLAEAGGLDPKTAFRGRDLTGWPLAGKDIRGVDFTGADLRGTGIESALRDQTTILNDAVFDFNESVLIDLPSVPEDYLEQAKRLIIQGIAPPLHWAPLIDEIDINEKDFFDLSPLSSLHALKKLSLSGTSVSDLSTISTMDNIERLNLSGTEITSLHQIENLKNLKFIGLDRVKLDSFDTIAKFANLSSVWLDDSNITELSPLSNLKLISFLWIQRSPIKNIFPICKLPVLSSLHMSGVSLEDYSQFRHMKNLRKLSLDSSNIIDLEFCKSLEFL